MTEPLSPKLVRVTVTDLYTDTDLILVGQAQEIVAQLREVFAWLRPSPPPVLALEHLVDIIDAEQCFSAEIDTMTVTRSSP